MDKVEIAVIPKTVKVEKSVSLHRVRVPGFESGLRFQLDDLYAIETSYMGKTDKVKSNVCNLMVYASGSCMGIELDESDVNQMLDYLQKVKQQIGKQVDYEHSFQK